MDPLTRGLELERAGDPDGAEAAYRAADVENVPSAALGLARLAEARGDDESAEGWGRRAGDLELASTGTLEWWMVRPTSEMNFHEFGEAVHAIEARQAAVDERFETFRSAEDRDELDWQRLLAEQRLLVQYTDKLVADLERREEELEETSGECSSELEDLEMQASAQNGEPAVSGFITVLADAYLVAGDESGQPAGDLVLSAASGDTICLVAPAIAAEALANPQRPGLLGAWPATFRDVYDEWNIWHALDVVWASSSDVIDPEHAVALIERFCEEADRADAMGDTYSPDPPGRPGGHRAKGRGESDLGSSVRSGLSAGLRAGLSRAVRPRR